MIGSAASPQFNHGPTWLKLPAGHPGGIATGAAKEDFPGTMCGATGEAGQVQGGVLRKGPGVASREAPTEREGWGDEIRQKMAENRRLVFFIV